MHFVGDSDSGLSPAPTPSEPSAELPMPRYRVAVMRNGKKTWLPYMRGMVDEGGSADTYAGEPGQGIVDVEFEGGSLGPNGWFTKNMKGDKLIGLTVFYDTPDPASTSYYEAFYRAHWLSDPPAWGKWEQSRVLTRLIELTIARC